MTRWYSDYPGLAGRVDQIRGLLEELDKESQSRYGRSVDVALFTEYALTAGKQGPAKEIAVSIDATILEPLGELARRFGCNLVIGGVFRRQPTKSDCINGAVVIDRQGQLVGQYAKVHPVLDRPGPSGEVVFEGGLSPGSEYNAIDLDFGRIGVQICYDIKFPEGWRRLKENGAELVLFPTQSPQLTRPAMYAATQKYWVVSSTF